MPIALSLGSIAARLLLAGPALAGGFECPERGGPAWREVRTVHFVVQTDASSGRARELAEDLERIHETVRFGLFQKPPETGVIRVLALRDVSEFDLFAFNDLVAAFYSPRALAGPVIVLPATLGDQQRAVVAHEITHHIAARVFARQPRWFSEGLATFMETVGESGPEHRRVVDALPSAGAGPLRGPAREARPDRVPSVGGVPRGRLRLVYPFHGGVERVLRAKGFLESAEEYSLAWALVHFLVNRHPQEFAQLQQRFARGQEPGAAWREVFPRWSVDDAKGPKALDGEIGEYLALGQFRLRTVQLPPVPEVAERPLTAAEAHGARLSVPWRNRGKDLDPGLMRAELAETLEHDAANVPALAVLSRLEPGRAPELARRAAEGHPEDARAWILLAGTIPEAARAGRIEPLARAARLDPENPEALNDLAWELLGAGRAAEALPIAGKAVGLAPGQAAYLDTYAGALEALGRCADALRFQHRALDVLPEGLRAKERAPYQERLDRLEKCAAGAEPQVPAAAAPSSR